MSESENLHTRQPQQEFERELLAGADEIMRRTNEAEEPMSVSRSEMELEREAMIELHESKDEFEDGSWGLMPIALGFAILGIFAAAWAVAQIS